MPEKSFVRQLATIANIDAVGYSLMMGRDEERTLAAFELRRAIIYENCKRHGGRMFGAAGDSMMAEFGSPIDSLHAAFEFQRQIAEANDSEPDEWKMKFRVGINTGDAIVRDGLLIGDDVNIAARLQAIAPAGGIVISSTTHEHVRGKLAADFVYLGEKRLRHIQFPVGAYSCSRTKSGVDGEQAPALPERVSVRTGDARETGPPAVAVLPFRNMSNDPDMEFVADGISGDIASGLANTRWLPVISRSSTFQFRDENMDSITAGKTLGAGYVVTGTVVFDDNRIRLNATLEDVATARTVWTRRYDREFSSVLKLQDELGTEIIAMLEQQLDRAEQVRAFQTPWEDLETWQLVRRGRWHMHRRTSEDTRRAFDCFNKAMKRDANSSAVLNEMAWWYFWRAWLRLGNPDDLDKVEKYAKRALYMDSQDARPHAYLGVCEIMRKHPANSLDHLIEALRIDPSFAFAYSALGSANLLLGKPREAIPHFMTVKRLSPFDIYQFHNLCELASAYFHLGDYEEAIRQAEQSLSLSPGYFLSSVVKTASLVHLDRLKEAAAQVRILYQRLPDFTLERVEWIPYVDRSYNQRMIDAFRVAEN